MHPSRSGEETLDESGALAVTESAELPSSLLQCSSSSSSSSRAVEETVLLRRALDKSLKPLGVYLTRETPRHGDVPNDLASFLAEVMLLLLLLLLLVLLLLLLLLLIMVSLSYGCLRCECSRGLGFRV